MFRTIKVYVIFAFLLLSISSISCQGNNSSKTFLVKNKLKINRISETVAIPASQISELIDTYGAEKLQVKETSSGKLLITQSIDYDGDSKVDEIIFQSSFKAGDEKEFVIGVFNDDSISNPKITTYSRFVPERIDDYAWENDKVAFRTYGPEAQRITESGKPGGTLTSGMDCWFKRVDYPIIDKWYKGNLEQGGYYHKDHGEGYDPYHVGDSRGCGGIGILIDDSLYVSKNFISYKTIATGPIRTVFELTYAPWSARGITVTETKRISLDLGSNLTRFEEIISGDSALPNCTIGITLHDKKGDVKVDSAAGWARYWEPMDGSELGTGIVVDPAIVKSYKDHRVETKDQSHIFVITNSAAKKLVYYAGFGWKKSGQFNSQEEWDKYLADFSQRISTPLEVAFR